LVATLVASIEGLIIHACIQNGLGIELQVGTQIQLQIAEATGLPLNGVGAGGIILQYQ